MYRSTGTRFPRTAIPAMIVFLVPLSFSAGQDFYDVSRVNTVRVYFAEENWDEILDSLCAADEGGRLTGSAVINGVRFESVGVKYKGQSSYNPGRIKNPFNIKLDHAVGGQSIDGKYGTLKLSNVYKDPSFVREVLGYEIARKYMPAGGANYLNLFINDTLIGLYVNDQDVDKYFLRTHFDSDENAFFKGVIDLDTVPVVWGYAGPDSASYMNNYELQSDSGWRELIEFLFRFNADPAAMESILTVDRLLWLLAYEILMVNLDSPINTGQNYYLYENKTDQFMPLIWDLNENFGAYRQLANGSTLNLIQEQRLDPFFNENNSNYPIINKVLSDSTRKMMYIAHLKTMIADNFSNGWYAARALEIQDIIDTFVRNDPNKFYSYNDFIRNINYSVGTGPQAIFGIAELMNTRTTYLLGLPALQGSAPSIAGVSHAPEKIYPNTSAWFLVSVDSAESVTLGYRQNHAGIFNRVRMFDDGVHNDGVAGDGVYGVSIPLGAGDVEYYIYAQNPSAASFSPARAEFEYYVLPLTGGKFVALEAGSPNPFNTTSSITYHIPCRSRATLYIYDVSGRVVGKLVDEEKEAGSYRVNFTAGTGALNQLGVLSSGVYFARLTLIPSGGDRSIDYEGATKLVYVH